MKLAIVPVNEMHGLLSMVTVSLSRAALRLDGSDRLIETVLPVIERAVSAGTESMKVYEQSVLQAEGIPLTVTCTVGLLECVFIHL